MARSVDVFQQHLKDTLKHAAAHKGSAFVEILQNCNIFNDGAWFDLTENDARSEHVLQLEHGKPLVFGKNRDKGIRRKTDGDIEVVQLGNGVTESDLSSTTRIIRAPPMLSCFRTWSTAPASPPQSAFSAPGTIFRATKM